MRNLFKIAVVLAGLIAGAWPASLGRDGAR